MEPQDLIHTSPLADKSLWVAIATPLVIMALKLAKIQIDDATVAAMVGTAVTFIASSKFKQAHVAAQVVNAGLVKQADDATKLLNPTASAAVPGENGEPK